MLVGIKGGLGDGKTSVLTYIALKQFVAGQNVYANYSLNFPNGAGKVVPFSSDDLVNGNWEGPGILCLDELQMWMESRISGSEFNRASSHMVLQTRKKNTHIAFTTQFFDQVDLRIRRLMDAAIECKRKKDYTKLSIWRKSDGQIIEKKLYLPPLYGLFNTNEVIKSLSYEKQSDREKVSKKNVDVPI